MTCRIAAAALALSAGLAVAAAPAHAADANGLPKALAWTAYDVGSAGYAQAVAIGAALRNRMGVTLRVLPGKNDVSRLLPLREKKVEFSAFGVGAWQAMEAMDTFGQKEWGPQAVRMLASNMSNACSGLVMAGDVGIKKLSDLKGKRIAWVKGSPSLNLNAWAVLRFAGLDWNDVTKVEFGGYGGSFDGLIEGQVDAVFTISTAGNVLKVFSSPRGGVWLPFPFSDKEAWARFLKAAPYYVQHMCSEGADLNGKPPIELAAFPYPILVAYASQKDDMVYAMTKAMYDLYPDYKGAAPGNDGWSIDRQTWEWVMPYHPGAIRYYKEVGKWTPAAEAHQEKMLQRTSVLEKTWKAYTATQHGDDFDKGWMKARADALEKAGMDPIYKEW